MQEPVKSDDEAKRREEALKEAVLRRFLEPKARERLSNLRLVNPDLVVEIREFIYNLAVSGRLKKPLSDEELKSLLHKIQSSRRREYRFRGLW